MLLLGSDYVATTFDSTYAEVAHTAQEKIEAIMPEKQRIQVQQLRDSIHLLNLDEAFHAPNITESDQEILGLVRRAVLEQRELSFTYRSRRSSPYASEEPSCTRNAHPYGLVHQRGIWYFVGHCTMRNELRQFRLERMESVTLLTSTFARPSEFRMSEYEPEQNFLVEVTVSFTKEAASWVRENPSFYLTNLEEREDDVLVTLHCRNEQDILQWVLSWGRYARVLQPQSLRESIKDHAAFLVDAYRELEPS